MKHGVLTNVQTWGNLLSFPWRSPATVGEGVDSTSPPLSKGSLHQTGLRNVRTSNCPRWSRRVYSAAALIFDELVQKLLVRGR